MPLFLPGPPPPTPHLLQPRVNQPLSSYEQAVAALGPEMAVRLHEADPGLTTGTQGTLLRGVNMTSTWNAGSPLTLTQAQQLAEVDKIAAAKADVLRFWFPWGAWETSTGVYTGTVQGGAQTVESRFDAIMVRARSYGIKVILEIYDDQVSASITPVSTVLARCQASMQRLLTLWPDLYAIEVWNEPNTTSFWPGTAAQYATLVNSAVAAKKVVNDSGQFNPPLIMAGAILGNDTTFLNACYSGGMTGHGALSIHPYSFIGGGTPWWQDPGDYNSPFKTAITGIRAAQVAAGDSAPLYLTEFGFAHPGGSPFVPDVMQRAWIRSSFLIAGRDYSYVQGGTVWTVNDIPTGGGNWDVWSGIQNLTPWVLGKE